MRISKFGTPTNYMAGCLRFMEVAILGYWSDGVLEY
jgi:hypothetical protein